MSGVKLSVVDPQKPLTLSGLGAERLWKPTPLRRVDIVAMGLSCAEFAKDCYHQGPRERDHQVWTVNSGVAVFKSDLVWNMHDLEQLPEKIDYKGVYNQHPDTPLVTVRALKDVPHSLEFPFAQFVQEYQNNYFACTVSYMLAGALMCGAKEIHIYGADFNYPGVEAYEAGRGSVEFWLGYAAAKGVRVVPAAASTLMDMIHRIPGQKGAIGYGAVYGYFNTQPQFDIVGDRYEVIGFDPLPEPENVRDTR